MAFSSSPRKHTVWYSAQCEHAAAHMALPEGASEALFIAEILADTAANSWKTDSVELPSTDVDAELLELLSSLDKDVAEFTDCMHRVSALASAKKATQNAIKTRLADAKADAENLDIYSEHNSEVRYSTVLFELPASSVWLLPDYQATI